MRGKSWRNSFVAVLCVLVGGCGTRPEESKVAPKIATEPGKEWKDSFDLDKCTLLTAGRNTYFVLVPGYQIVLAEPDGEKKEEVFITVLDETETVDGVETRVVEEREYLNGGLKEVSRNFFTICREHGDVFYHGEDVDDYEGGKVTGHGGAWRAGVKGARAGLMMAGRVEVGAKHYQEIAPGVAMDRAENVSVDETLETPAGEFSHCLKVVETSPLEPGSQSIKVYAPGVGMAVDGDLIIVHYGARRSPPAAPAAPAKRNETGADAAPARVEPPVAEAPAPVTVTSPVKRAQAPTGKPTSEVEVEVEAEGMPGPVAAVVAKLHPTGRIHEVKREKHADGRVVYAVEVFVGERQHDVETTEDGTVLRNKAE